MIKTIIKENNYMDSIFLMKVAKEMMALAAVKNAVVVMGSDMNKTVVEEFGGLNREAQAAGPNDLIISLDLTEEAGLAAAEEKLALLLSPEGKQKKAAAQTDVEYPTLGVAYNAHPGANLAIISVPNDFAYLEARAALARDMNVFIFSDMPLADEVALKRISTEKGLFVMGPSAGTAVINNISIGLMSKVRRGGVGIVAASGSGLQEVAVLVHRKGEGVSQAIGTGGHDLSKEVGGATMLQGIEYLSNDPETKVLVLISKPPHPDTAKKIFAALPKNKPVVVFFLGGDRQLVKDAGAYAPATLEEAAEMAVALVRGEAVPGGDYVAVCRESLKARAREAKAKLQKGQTYMRGLFCGGTHSEEVVMLLEKSVPSLHSNIPFGKVEMLKNRHVSVENSLVDMGDEEFCKGRPHPVMDPSILVGRMLQEADDPAVGVIVFDLLYGYGIHKDPVGAIEEALRGIRARSEARGQYISLIASLCGTDMEPQNVADQKRRLEEYGVLVLESNARAAMLAGLIVS